MCIIIRCEIFTWLVTADGEGGNGVSGWDIRVTLVDEWWPHMWGDKSENGIVLCVSPNEKGGEQHDIWSLFWWWSETCSETVASLYNYPLAFCKPKYWYLNVSIWDPCRHEIECVGTRSPRVETSVILNTLRLFASKSMSISVFVAGHTSSRWHKSRQKLQVLVYYWHHYCECTIVNIYILSLTFMQGI